MSFRQIFSLYLLLFSSFVAYAQGEMPSVSAIAVYVDSAGVSQETTKIGDGEAPLEVTFMAKPSNMGSHTPSYEWHFKKEGSEGELFVRYEENTTYRFVESGSYEIILKTILTDTGEELPSNTINVAISESRLEFPNAFSPNNDGTNDLYGAKGVNDPNSPAHYKSIVEFHAYIFNRWGQKLFEWTDVSKGWDGKYKGHDVEEGVYYVLVKARGADGRKYNIKKDVNLLRGFTEGTNK